MVTVSDAARSSRSYGSAQDRIHNRRIHNTFVSLRLSSCRVFRRRSRRFFPTLRYGTRTRDSQIPKSGALPTELTVSKSPTSEPMSGTPHPKPPRTGYGAAGQTISNFKALTEAPARRFTDVDSRYSQQVFCDCRGSGSGLLRIRLAAAQLGEDLQHAVEMSQTGTEPIHEFVQHVLTLEQMLFAIFDLFGQGIEELGLHA